MQIQDKAMVSLRYVMKNMAGEIVEENMHGKPVQYLHGSGKILPSLESSLYRLEAGDKKSIRLKVNEMSAHDDFTLDVIIDEVREASEDELLNSEPLIEAVSSCGPGCDC